MGTVKEPNLTLQAARMIISAMNLNMGVGCFRSPSQVHTLQVASSHNTAISPTINSPMSYRSGMEGL